MPIRAGNYEKAAVLQMQVVKARQYLHIPSSTNAACYAVLEARGIDVGTPKNPSSRFYLRKRTAMLEAFAAMGLL